MTAPSHRSNKSTVTDRLVGVIRKMPVGEQQALLNELEERSSKLKRKHHRKPIKTAVEYSTKDHIYKDFTQDISPGGIFIETRMPFLVGQDILLSFILPAHPQKRIRINGQIVRITPRGIGVQFKTVTEKHETIMHSLLDAV